MIETALNNTKHTPGPWKWVESGEYGYSSLFNPVLNVEIITTGGLNDGDNPITWMGEELSSADASLIAAAPELLEALKDILSVTATVIDDDGNPGEDICQCSNFSAARAAIAKATGDGQ